MTKRRRKIETMQECPFCQKGKVKTFHKEGYLQARTSRISAGAKTKYYRVPETYEILSGCSNCRKSLKEVKEAFEGKKKLPHEERIKLWKEQGLPLIWESK